MAANEEIGFEEFTAFLKARGADSPCPICKNDTWFADIPTRDYLTLRRFSVEGDRPARVRVTMVCSNCGFVREHDMDMVIEWKNTKT